MKVPTRVLNKMREEVMAIDDAASFETGLIVFVFSHMVRIIERMQQKSLLPVEFVSKIIFCEDKAGGEVT